MILSLLTIFVSLTVVYGDVVITIKNQTHIWCATDVRSPIFILPPAPREARHTTNAILEDDTRWGDGWVLKNSSDVALSDVTDKRWEDFGVIYTKEIHFNAVTSIGYSSFGSAVHSIVSDVDKTKSRRKRALSASWSHSFSSQSAKKNGTNIFGEFQFTAKTAEETYWRIHDYKVRYADTVSTGPFEVVISPNDSSCLIVYMYMCRNCTLKVDVPGSANTFYTGRLSWDSLKFEVRSNKVIRLFRNTTNGDRTGFWGIDIRACPKTISDNKMAIYDDSLENAHDQKSRVCSTLQLSSSSFQKTIFDCEPGRLGQKCEVTCESLLGTEGKYCQKRTICDNSLTKTNCRCAWGYQGQQCDQPCPAGTWGLSCAHKCSNCESCNQQTGDCKNSAMSYFGKEIGLMILGLSVLFFI